MAFQEKSAWVMIVALTVTGLFYLNMVIGLSGPHGLAPPFLPSLIVYTVALTAVAILGHIVIAVLSPKEASAELDERERSITYRASHWSGYILGGGVVFSLVWYLFSYDGNRFFYSVFASLVLSALAEYIIQVVLYRRGLV